MDRNDMLERRVSRAFEWVSGILASLVVIALVWVGSTLTEIKEAQAVITSELKYSQRVNDSQDARLSIYDDRLRAVEQEVRWKAHQ